MTQDYGTIVKYGVIGVGILGGLYVLSKIAEIGKEAVEVSGGLLTGNNAITEGARTDAYKNAGIVGTLGAATDRTLGGLPSATGEALGGAIYDAKETVSGWYDSVLQKFRSSKY